jgi:ParB family transcriptional regulator, chromosome partitioning protein
MNSDIDLQIRMIRVDQINVLNPRGRGKKKFAQIVDSIEKVGLKRPVTVAPAEPKNGQPMYDLVCGQGRLEAYIAHGETKIPASVIRGTREDLLLMSLAENVARRQHSTIELVREIRVLKDRGYSYADVAAKTGLAVTYVRGILALLAKGEERLLQAVQKEHIPVSIAITIATSDDKAVQSALTEAYERNDLRGKALLRARRLIENRRARGKRIRAGCKRFKSDPVSADALLKTYQEETIRQKMVVQRSKICETRLLFACSALKQLFQDDNFITLLRAEELDSLPQYLADQVLVPGAAS